MTDTRRTALIILILNFIHRVFSHYRTLNRYALYLKIYLYSGFCHALTASIATPRGGNKIFTVSTEAASPAALKRCFRVGVLSIVASIIVASSSSGCCCIDVSVTRDKVKISGKFEHKKENKGNGYYISEFNYKEFERTINLPVPIRNDEVTAEYNDGILVLELPKLEEVKHKVFKVHLGGNGKKVLDTEKQ